MRFIKKVSLLLTAVLSAFVLQLNAQTTPTGVRKAPPAQWTVYQQIAHQATEHSAFDVLLAKAQQAQTDAETAAYESQLWVALKELLTTGTTATGQFDLTALIDKADDVSEFSNTKTADVQHTLKDLPAGHYTLKVQGFHRPSEYLIANTWYENARTTYTPNMYFGSTQQGILNINDDARYSPLPGCSVQQGAHRRVIPSNLSAAKTAFQAGLYWNVMRATLSEDGDVTFGVKITQALNNNWVVCGHFRLYYGAETVTMSLAKTQKLAIADDTYANVSVDMQLTPGTMHPVSFPFSMTTDDVSANFKAAYQLGGVEMKDEKLVAYLIPVAEMRAGQSYYVQVDKTAPVTADNVLVRAARPDSVPAVWEGAAMVGGYKTNKGCVATLYLDGALKAKQNTLSFQPIDLSDVRFATNLENAAARKYLSDVKYTEASPSVIYNYYITPPVRRDQPKPVVIPAPLSDKALTLTLATHSDLSDATTLSYPAGTTLCEVQNLVPQRDYYYKVEADGSLISTGQFHTDGVVRMLRASSISNIRDLGGWTNCDGNKIRYERIYRGSEMNQGQVLNAADLKKMQALGIGAEIDLRSRYNVGGSPLTTSALGAKVNYFFADLGRWSDNTLQLDVSTWSNTFKFLVKNVNAGKPLYFHCQVGADRTGCLAQLIEGVLGFSRDQMYHDYELTSYSQAGERRKVKVDPAINYVIQSSKGHTMQQHYFHYITTKLSVPAADLAAFVDNMVDGESTLLHYPLHFDFEQESYFESLADVYALCTMGSTVASDANATLQPQDGTSKSVKMSVEGGIFITFAQTTLTPATTYTLTIPAGSVTGPDGSTNAEAVTLTFRTPSTFATQQYLYAPSVGKFLSRGANFGSRIIADDMGLPVSFETNTDGNRRIRFLDNGLYVSHDGYGDRASNADNLEWIIEPVADGYVLKASSGKYMSRQNNYLTASATSAAGAVVFVSKTAAEQKALVQQKQTDSNLEAARKAGLDAETAEELKSLLAGYTTSNQTSKIKNASTGSTSVWTLTEPADAKTASAQAYNAGDYGGELFNKHGYVGQTVSVDQAGLYKVTATILSRQGSNANCYSLGKQGYALSNAYIAVNDTYWAQIPDWYSGAAGSANPDNTSQAKTLMGQGKYKVEFYAYVDNSKQLTIRIYQPAYTTFVWCVFNNFTLTRIETGGGGDDTQEEDYTGEGYANLEASMFRHWDDAVNPTTSEAVACEYHIDEAAVTPYGDELLTYLNFADLSDYDKLIIVVTEGTPRLFFNKVDGGKYNASDEAASGRIEITPSGGWAEKYYTERGGTWTIDLKKMVAEKGYARLNGIKGPTYNTTVTISKMVLYKDTGSGGDDKPDDPEELEAGYSKLEASMFRHWDDAVNPTTNEAVACEYHIDEPAVTVYGDGNLTYLNFADISDYDKLIVEVSESTPRLFFNKVDGGKYYANDEAASGRFEISPVGGWAERYYTEDAGTWTIDLKKIVQERGYARLNGIKGPTSSTTVTVSRMLLYKEPGTGLDAVNDGRQALGDTRVYSLSGQQISRPQKGINIVAGRKLLVR